MGRSMNRFPSWVSDDHRVYSCGDICYVTLIAISWYQIIPNLYLLLFANVAYPDRHCKGLNGQRGRDVLIIYCLSREFVYMWHSSLLLYISSLCPILLLPSTGPAIPAILQ